MQPEMEDWCMCGANICACELRMGIPLGIGPLEIIVPTDWIGTYIDCGAKRTQRRDVTTQKATRSRRCTSFA